MRNLNLCLLLSAFILFCHQANAQQSKMADSLGLPGDNLNLYGVLDLFQNSKTLESFEQKLNDKDSKLNNLDLNGDNKIDYIRVVDNVKGNAHAIALKVDINDKESQDVAVIEVEKDNQNQIHIQIVGDELLYGKDYIVEPGTETPNPGYTGNQNATNPATPDKYVPNDYSNDYNNSYIVPSSERWVVVDYMYGPAYVVYVSPFYWGYYPNYWNPWAPYYFYDYYYFPHPYYSYYHRCHFYRSREAHEYYGPRRSHSDIVYNKIQQGDYKSTYSHDGPVNAPAPRPNTHQPETPRPVNNPPEKQTSAPRPSTPHTISRPVTPGTVPRPYNHPVNPRQNTPSSSPRPVAPTPKAPRQFSPRPAVPPSSPKPHTTNPRRSSTQTNAKTDSKD